ncbi:uncharacterized protein A1O5_06997 [Cladophialophora psammophila CBS 110553]|uniref:Uncharacterized protein n=1 Tax=Cladophialophora psammophila CBS 110553 TaxID=1182543 RepID=W9XHU7_9EURO|nr:uncharacterized protein A1O5_06997 [Cladophialophora psammophila CBS 110553]EXJ69924.1 hypothetical protein A1O5_06997 [Cladophialophora psammophila CBS 110553]
MTKQGKFGMSSSLHLATSGGSMTGRRVKSYKRQDKASVEETVHAMEDNLSTLDFTSVAKSRFCEVVR